MATYNPPQSFWKRAVVGVLDLCFSFVSIGNLVHKSLGLLPASGGAVGGSNDWVTARGPGFYLEGWPAAIMLLLVVAYFVVLGRTGGTLFQRLFGFKRT